MVKETLPPLEGNANNAGDNGNGSKKSSGVDTCECRSGPIFGSTLVGGATFAGKWLHYAEVEGQAMFEGDIVLGRVADLEAAAEGEVGIESIGVTGAQLRWPNGRVPYQIDPTLPNPQRVTDAIAHWHAHTQIRFVERTTATAAQFPDYVVFVPGGGCSSMVGRRSGRQDITLGTNCTAGNAIHEIGHTVGLWHEQSREDRDTFVRIVFANIDPSMQHNFSQHIADGDDLGGYDFGSVMHYPANAFSINGQPTIVPRQPLPSGTVMGQRTGLSAGDLAGVRAMYPNLGPTVKEVRKDPIRDPVTIKEVRKDPVTDPTIKEVRKDPIRDPVTIKEVRKDPVTDPVPVPWPVPGPGPLGGAYDPGAVPFVLAGASRYAPQGFIQADPLAEAEAHVQQLAEAHTQAQAQADALAQAYEQAVQVLASLYGGSGTV